MPTSLLLFLASSGSVPGQQPRPVVTIQLTDTEGQNHSLGEQPVSCDTTWSHSSDPSLLSPAPPCRIFHLPSCHVGGADVNQKQIPEAGLVTSFFALSHRDARAVLPAQPSCHQRDPEPGGPIPTGCFSAPQLLLSPRGHCSHGPEDPGSAWPPPHLPPAAPGGMWPSVLQVWIFSSGHVPMLLLSSGSLCFEFWSFYLLLECFGTILRWLLRYWWKI